VDEAIFHREMQSIFGQTWVYVGHESELPAPGDFKTVVVGQHPMVLIRDDDGSINVLLNRCRHRAAVLCRTEHGSVGNIRCPYHGWTYAKDGTLIGVPNPAGYPVTFDTTALSLRRAARIDNYRGLLFVNLSSDAPSLAEHLGPIRRYIDWWFDRAPDGAIKVMNPPHRVHYPGNWKWQAENGHDGYHGDFVHESYHRTEREYGAPRPLPKPRVDKCTRGFKNGHGLFERRVTSPWLASWTGKLMHTVPEYERIMRERFTEDQLDDITARRDIFIFPNLYLFETHIRVIEPVTRDSTTVKMQFYELTGAPTAVTESRMQSHERFFGPSGLGTPDDIEMFVRNETGIRAFPEDAVVLSRGMHREWLGSDGEVVGDPSDEVPLRAFYREWKRLMG
jgi:phenylpropionate dioxygenase-like ring-hydroxylating dioxygenase large terminal subunit